MAVPIPSRRPFTSGSLRFQILDRGLAGAVTSEESYASLSITGSEQGYAPLAESPRQMAVLKIRFDDIQVPIPTMTLFGTGQAEAILDFFGRARGLGMCMFLINCEQGVCRSAAAGAALAQLSGGRTDWFFRRFAPNAHVYDTLVAAGEARREHRNAATSGGKNKGDTAE